MKPKKNKKPTFPPYPAMKISPDVELTPDQKLRLEWERLSKYPEYFDKFQKQRENGSLYEKGFFEAIKTIQDLMKDEEWLSENTPFPFKVIHDSPIADLAFLICGHLKKVALADNQHAIKILAYITVEMTETLTQLLTSTSAAETRSAALIKALRSKFDDYGIQDVKSNFEVMQNTAHEIPYWPMLRFLNTSANSKKQFKRIAESLELGKNCPINVSENANYSLETPINSFVWKCLRHFQVIHWHIRYALDPASHYAMSLRTVGGKAPKPLTLEWAVERFINKREEIPIYKESVTLPPLTKLTAQVWADKAIMPYVCSKYSDFASVPEFSNIFKRSGVKTRGQQRAQIRKDIIRSLISMARPKA
jgi:hypothetical protein